MFLEMIIHNKIMGKYLKIFNAKDLEIIKVMLIMIQLIKIQVFLEVRGIINFKMITTNNEKSYMKSKKLWLFIYEL